MTERHISRRDCLKLALAGGASLLLPEASAQNTFQTAHITEPAQPQRQLYQLEERYRGFDRSVALRLRRVGRRSAPQMKRDIFQGYYLDKGVLVPEAYSQICYAFRDWRLGEHDGVVQIDINLLNLMAAIQIHLDRVTGRQTEYLLTSGYRSPRTNAGIEGAAKNSLHMRGMAGDVVVPGVPIEYLNRLALYFQTGGVGLYSRSQFVHMDSGRFRSWKGN